MLVGMAVTHAFVPPTPGPTAVANLLGADLGWVITVGIAAGLPTLIITAIFASKVLSRSPPAMCPSMYRLTHLLRSGSHHIWPLS